MLYYFSLSGGGREKLCEAQKQAKNALSTTPTEQYFKNMLLFLDYLQKNPAPMFNQAELALSKNKFDADPNMKEIFADFKEFSPPVSSSSPLSATALKKQIFLNKK